ncbi:MAG: winged helix-turn-helix transcriptional regulator [bacterium]|nr:winged helix-turn-helix transcriptional regulator [bacterium]
MPDKFFLEGDVNKSLRNIILREMVSNVLMHREFTNSYTAKFVIENERMYVENANRAASDGYITENRLEPIPKNPVIASFFRNIGYADQLGSGVRNLFKYSKYYSGQMPEFIEGDIFRIIVPLDEGYSSDFGQNGQTNQSNQSNQSDQMQFSEDEMILLNLIKESPDMTNSLLAEKLGWSVSRVKYYIQKLKQFEKIRRKGTSRNGKWEVL